MLSAPRTIWIAVVLAGALSLSGAACADDSADSAGGAATAETSDAEAPDTATAGADETAEFCAAVEVVDGHDGTTEESEAVAALEELRRTAPAELRDDVELATDTLIVNNYPGSADPSAVAASPEDAQATGERLATYIDENC